VSKAGAFDRTVLRPKLFCKRNKKYYSFSLSAHVRTLGECGRNFREKWRKYCETSRRSANHQGWRGVSKAGVIGRSANHQGWRGVSKAGVIGRSANHQGWRGVSKAGVIGRSANHQGWRGVSKAGAFDRTSTPQKRMAESIVIFSGNITLVEVLQ
jgi:hypothetical protein